MDRLKPGTRIIDTRSSCRTGIVLAHTDCKIVNKYPEGTDARWNEKARAEYTWVEFSNGGTNGWMDLPYYLQAEKSLEDKVEEARAALAAAEAALEAAKLPHPGDRYSSAFNNTTATVKFVDGDVIYYEFRFNQNQVVSYAGRKIESFLKAYETKLGDCGC